MLRHGDFERILVFDRRVEPETVTDREFGGTKQVVKNVDKIQFLSVLNLAMLICSFADADRRGQVAIYEKV